MRPWLIGVGIAGAIVVLVGAVVAGLYAAMIARFNPPPPAAVVTKSATPLEAQRDDIRHFGKLIALDRSYAPEARRAAETALRDLAASATVLPPPKLRMALMRVGAMADNGHTSAFSAPHGRPNAAPIRLFDFADGVRVMRADAANADLLGAELTGVEGRPTAAVLDALAAYRGGTAATRRHWAVQRALISPELLFGAGLAAETSRATYGFRRRDGVAVNRTLVGLPQPDDAADPDPVRWLSPQPAPHEPRDWRAYRPEGPAAPLGLSDPDRAFRFAWVDNSCVAYIQLRANLDVDGQSIAAFENQARRKLNERQACGAILDLRYDGGGDWVNDVFPVRVRTLDPDQTIPLTFSDYRAGRDRVADRALALVGQSPAHAS